MYIGQEQYEMDVVIVDKTYIMHSTIGFEVTDQELGIWLG